MEHNASTAVRIGAAASIATGSGDAVGTVGSSIAPGPAMSGHQQGASEPLPWCIVPGIVEWWGHFASPCSVAPSGPPTSQQGSASNTRQRNDRTRSRIPRIVYATRGGWRNRGRPR
jgi:hypothetical protein